MTFLFVAPYADTWGETTLAVRAARELVQRRHRVVFALPRALAHACVRGRIEVVDVGVAPSELRRLVTALVRRTKAAALVLVDENICAWALTRAGGSAAFLGRLDVPVMAFDVWDAAAQAAGWDLLDRSRAPRRLAHVDARIQPVPFLRPVARPGRYNALPGAVASTTVRRQTRARLGLSSRDRLIVIASAAWQAPEAAWALAQRRMADHLPSLLAARVGQLPDTVKVLHVGPQQFRAFSQLGRRYQWSRQLSSRRFERLLHAADLFLSANASSTAAMTAMSVGVPVMTAVNSYRLTTAAQIRRVRARTLSPSTRRWLEVAMPLHPFAVWPIGLSAVMRRAFQRNPYRRLLHVTEILDERQFTRRLNGLLGDDLIRRSAVDAFDAYRDVVMSLPGAADAILRACPQPHEPSPLPAPPPVDHR